MKRVMITGAHGLLGQKLVEQLSYLPNYELLATSAEPRTFLNSQCDYTQLDITARGDVKSLVANYHPAVIINAAAFTNVDECENEREHAWRVNVDGVKNLIIAARKIDAQIIHLSTDYVFDGKNGPYHETDRPNPLSYYGKTKLAGENALHLSGVPHTIVRTMVLYGVARNVRPNFALWLIEELRQKQCVKVVDDQFGNPTLVDDLAYGILKIVELERQGTYHICGSEFIDRYHVALKLADVFGFDKRLITPIKTADLNQPAPRPLKSGFITLKAETELGIKAANVEQGLHIVKRQLEILDAVMRN
jgi:dTDP-4-dehydrorhamnose reductase